MYVLSVFLLITSCALAGVLLKNKYFSWHIFVKVLQVPLIVWWSVELFNISTEPMYLGLMGVTVAFFMQMIESAWAK